MKRVLSVSVMDQNLTVRSEADEGEITRVSEYVNQKIQEVRRRSHGVSPLTAALLACMNIANECLSLKEIQGRAGQKIRELIGEINSHAL